MKMNTLKKLSLNKINVSQSHILRKKEMKDVLGGYDNSCVCVFDLFNYYLENISCWVDGCICSEGNILVNEILRCIAKS